MELEGRVFMGRSLMMKTLWPNIQGEGFCLWLIRGKILMEANSLLLLKKLVEFLVFILFKEWLDGKHVVFGKLVKGHEFLDEIEK